MEPRWTSSAKSGVGTAQDGRSLVWFPISHGIVDEVYYPRVDQANIRDLGLLVTGPDGFFSEEKRDAGTTSDYRLFALLAPHIGNQGYGNDGWSEDYKGVGMLFARRGQVSLAMACDAGWRATSCGFLGVNDGWNLVKRAGHLTEQFTEARDGNIALTGEIDLANAKRATPGSEVSECVLALAFGSGPAEAAQRARMTLAWRFDGIERSYLREWTKFHAETPGPAAHEEVGLNPEATRVGPVTGQDRWEENGGFTPFTLAVEIAALVVASSFVRRAGDDAMAERMLATADEWNDNIERWTYMTDTPLARRVGVEGYYVRIAPPDIGDATPSSGGMIPIKNRPTDATWQHYSEIVCPDALGLVRFGLRDAKDARQARSVAHGRRVFDMPQQSYDRYVRRRTR